jgi:hypothetical protein
LDCLFALRDGIAFRLDALADILQAGVGEFLHRQRALVFRAVPEMQRAALIFGQIGVFPRRLVGFLDRILDVGLLFLAAHGARSNFWGETKNPARLSGSVAPERPGSPGQDVEVEGVSVQRPPITPFSFIVTARPSQASLLSCVLVTSEPASIPTKIQVIISPVSA